MRLPPAPRLPRARRSARGTRLAGGVAAGAAGLASPPAPALLLLLLLLLPPASLREAVSMRVAAVTASCSVSPRNACAMRRVSDECGQFLRTWPVR